VKNTVKVTKREITHWEKIFANAKLVTYKDMILWSSGYGTEE
jgi:hypothetical protein